MLTFAPIGIPEEARRGNPLRSLYLLRHAKSSWGTPSLDDGERPLAPRGRTAAARMARHLRDEGIRPDLVLCSPARRAQETLEALEPALEGAPARMEQDLYAATAEELLAVVRRLPDGLGSVMLVAHNPGLQDVATMLAGTGRDVGRLREKYPTCALATLELGEAPWSALQPGGAELVSLVTPNDLA